jgi:hypothetical protein
MSRPEKLGTLLEEGIPAGTTGSCSDTTTAYRTDYDGFLDALLACAARTIALAGDSDLVIVGRSPESLFDLLSGLLAETSWQKETSQRLTLLRYSKGYTDEDVERPNQCIAIKAFRIYMYTLGLSPEKLIVRERPVALIDLVCSGDTMRQLLLLIRDWAIEEKVDWPAVRRKLCVVALVRKDDETPPRPRWKQRRDGRTGRWCWRTKADWIDELLDRGALREVAICSHLWDFLGNLQAKSTPSYPPDDWGTETAARPSHQPYHLAGLRAARRLYAAGCTPETRERFATLLRGEKLAMREAWCRRLVQEVRGV